MIATATDHYPKGKPRARLRSHPLICPLTGKALLGAACVGGACPYADESCGFVDCNAHPRPGEPGAWAWRKENAER